MRLTTAFNRILQLPGASVHTVAFTDHGLVIGLRRRRRRMTFPCSAVSRSRYDTSRRRWRHLDFGACQLWLEAEVHRLDCRACRQHWRRTRFVVRAGRERLDDQQRHVLRLLRRHRYRLWRTWELKEQLRDLYRTVDPGDARVYLRRWCASAKRSHIPAFANLVRRIEKHFEAIVAAVELGLSNSRLEGINAKIRLIQRRGFGFRNLSSLTAMIYCLGGVALTLPTET